MDKDEWIDHYKKQKVPERAEAALEIGREICERVFGVNVDDATNAPILSAVMNTVNSEMIIDYFADIMDALSKIERGLSRDKY